MSTTQSYRGAHPRTARLPFRDGKIDMTDEQGVAIMTGLIADAQLPPVNETIAEPFVGVTTDGTPLAGLFELADEGLNIEPVVSAARSYLQLLDAAEVRAASAAIDGAEWQLWTNAFLTFPEHGLLLDRLSEPKRDAALQVIAATVSAAGMHDIRGAMRLNAALGEICVGYEDTLREYKYWFTIFGVPSAIEPWGWQLMGHHLDINCFLMAGQIVLTPAFIGTELEGHDLFAEHISRGIELMDSLTSAQRNTAVLYPSIRSADLPRHLAGSVDGRHRAGAGRDNVVLPYEGIRADAFSPGQRELLVALTHLYLGILPDGPLRAKVAQVRRHLDNTSFAWIGGWTAGEPFYYKVHSPVLLIEYDNHEGVFFDNPEPEIFHVHTIVRTPNGGDYGKDLLAQHYQQYHQAGQHPVGRG